MGSIPSLQRDGSSVYSAGGISIVTFIVAVGISLVYYQFFYVPEANRKPYIPEDIRNPEESLVVTIVPDAVLKSTAMPYYPKEVRATIGINNRIVWENKDSTLHTVTTDDDYVDIINGKFDSLAHPDETDGGYIAPGKSWAFTFTKVGKYAYHCDPHPYMQGEIEVIENFS